MKKVLFMVPHEDDELLVGGPLLIDLVRDKEYDVSVFIATNGDYNPSSHTTRIQESLSVLASIGVSKDHIFFGGYGDCWQGKHIYNSADDEIKESHGGFKATYLVSNELYEWHYWRYNEHIPYTRRGYLNDIKELISTLLPDVLICVDMDSHGDHRCLSLLTEEALGEILKINGAYEPILLKKYAYQGVMFGRCDFFSYPHKRACNDSNSTSNPYYRWDERISYVVPEDCRTLFLFNNYLYKLAKMYHSQDTWVWASRFINEDIVFWRRNTNNILLKSEINVSSGCKKHLNDFKLLDVVNVNQEDCGYTELCWRPHSNDTEKTVSIKFKDCCRVKYVLVYFNVPGGIQGQYTLQYEDRRGRKKYSVRKLECSKDFFVDKIEIDSAEVANMKFDFANLVGNLGIGEIEAIDDFKEIPFKEYLYHEVPCRGDMFIIFNFFLFLEKMVYKPHAVIFSMMQRFRRSLRKRAKYFQMFMSIFSGVSLKE